LFVSLQSNTICYTGTKWDEGRNTRQNGEARRMPTVKKKQTRIVYSAEHDISGDVLCRQMLEARQVPQNVEHCLPGGLHKVVRRTQRA